MTVTEGDPSTDILNLGRMKTFLIDDKYVLLPRFGSGLTTVPFKSVRVRTGSDGSRRTDFWTPSGTFPTVSGVGHRVSAGGSPLFPVGNVPSGDPTPSSKKSPLPRPCTLV